MPRLHARPTDPAPTTLEPGLWPLGLGERRDGLLRVPAGAPERGPLPLLVMLHGAGSSAANGLAPLVELADDAGLLLLAVDSRASTWDAILGGFGPDVAFLDRALEHVFARCAVDPERIAVGGFSDGASYALSLGLANGDLLGRIVAFSPGFVAPAEPAGRPSAFVSHGVADPVLPIDRCSRRLVPALRGAGYDVTYREFPGGHVVPPGIAAEAVAWLAGGTGSGEG